MDFFKVKKFRKAHKPNPENDLEDKPVPQPEEPKKENGGGDSLGKTNNNNAEPTAEAEDDDDDFITNEVKRRLKELRRNSFMVLIPEEESCPEEEEEEEEEEGETSSSEWKDVEEEVRQWWGGFDAVYDKYCERMLFFDKMSTQQLNESGNFFYYICFVFFFFSYFGTFTCFRTGSFQMLKPTFCNLFEILKRYPFKKTYQYLFPYQDALDADQSHAIFFMMYLR